MTKYTIKSIRPATEAELRRHEAEKRRRAYWKARKQQEFWEAFWVYATIFVAGGLVVWGLTVPYLP